MKTLYITDLDGTFLNENGAVSEESKRIVNNLSKKGLLFSVATARSIMTAGELLKGLTINAPVVLMNGVFLFDLNEKRAVSFHEIEPTAFRQVVSAFQSHGKAPMLWLYGDDALLSVHYTELQLQINRDFYEERKESFQGRFRRVDALSVPQGQHAVYINLVDTFESLHPIAEALQSINGVSFSFYRDTYTKYWFLEVYSDKASKANGAQEVKKRVAAQRVVAFGDNLNDLSLFSAADEKYAVENAVDALKAQATAVIGSNRTDGVAKFLLEHFKSDHSARDACNFS